MRLKYGRNQHGFDYSEGAQTILLKVPTDVFPTNRTFPTYIFLHIYFNQGKTSLKDILMGNMPNYLTKRPMKVVFLIISEKCVEKRPWGRWNVFGRFVGINFWSLTVNCSWVELEYNLTNC